MQRKKQVSDLKNKIQKFSKGDFQLIRPDVIFDETNLVLIIGEGEVYRGSFTMKTNSKGTIRGLVYPSSFRVHFKDQGFEGNPAKVEFTYDGQGTAPWPCGGRQVYRCVYRRRVWTVFYRHYRKAVCHDLLWEGAEHGWFPETGDQGFLRSRELFRSRDQISNSARLMVPLRVRAKYFL